MKRRTPLRSRPKPCCGRTLCSCGERPSLRRSRLRAVSDRRRREQAKRRRILLETFGQNPACARCGRPADDAHELKRRSQGGDPTDPEGIRSLCRDCHTFVTENPVQAHAEGFHKWSWE